jgi:hypothetical protein
LPLLTSESADPVSRAKIVVSVDAAVDAPCEVELRPLAPAESSQILAHAAARPTSLALARHVFGHAAKDWWLTIRVENLSLDEEFPDLDQRGFATAVEKIKALRPTPR